MLNSEQKERLRELQVAVVYLFGSTVEQSSHTLSDIDIGILFTNNILIADTNVVYNQLYDLFTEVFPGKDIDLIFLQRTGLELKYDVIRHGQVIYEHQPAAAANFEEKISIMYADFKPLLNIFDRGVLDRI